nr:LacI family DNA-binding transcriptional regulator [Streptomyces sp. ST1020]
MRDVAELARVSQSSVSNYFHKPHKISDATRERIRQAVQTPGFVPNDAARMLRTGTSPVVGYVAFEPASATTPQIAAAIEQRVSAEGMYLLMANNGGSRLRERRCFAAMAAWVDVVRERTGGALLREERLQFGDWLDPDAPPDRPGDAKTDAGIVATAYFHRSAALTAKAAALLGLPYAYAHFIAPAATREALDVYRSAFVPGPDAAAPRPILSVVVCCAETDAEAERVYATHRLFHRRMSRGDVRPLPPADLAVAEMDRPGPDPLAEESFEWPRYVVGSPGRVRDQLTKMADATGAEELGVVSMIHDQGDRLRSYRLLAEAFELTPRT